MISWYFLQSCRDFVVVGVVEEIYKIGSMSSGAMLYEASREFQVTSL